MGSTAKGTAPAVEACVLASLIERDTLDFKALMSSEAWLRSVFFIPANTILIGMSFSLARAHKDVIDVVFPL